MSNSRRTRSVHRNRNMHNLNWLVLAAAASLPIGSASAQEVQLEAVGQTGGATYAVDVVGNLAYIGIGPRLVILDASNPADLITLGRSSPLSKPLNGIIVEGNHAFIAAEELGLAVADITDPTHPRWLGTFDTGGRAVDLILSGGFAYIADGNGLAIFDLSVPETPLLVGQLKTDGRANTLSISGHLIFLGDNQEGLMTIDISDPTLPLLVAKFPMHAKMNGIVIKNELAYVANGSSDILILDISDSSSPTELGTLELGSLELSQNGNRLSLEGTLLYFANGWNGVKVIDVADPTNPRWMGDQDTNGFASRVLSRDNRLYVADNEGGLKVLDMTDPRMPELIGQTEIGSWGHGVAVQNETLYLAGASIGGFQIFDVSNPTDPVRLSVFDAKGQAIDVVVRDDRAYLANGWGGLTIVDISDRTAPKLVREYKGIGYARDVALARNKALIATDKDGLWIIDIEDPDAPLTMRDNYIDSGHSWGIATDGERAFVADSELGLQAFDLTSDPLRLTDTYTGSGNAHVAIFHEGLLYTAARGDGLSVLDVSDPNRLVQIGGIKTGADMHDLAAAGHYVYVANRYHGMQVIDISDPTAPKLMAALKDSDQAFDIAVSGGYAYLADGAAGLVVVDLGEFMAVASSEPGPATPPPTLCGIGTFGIMPLAFCGWAGLRRRKSAASPRPK